VVTGIRIRKDVVLNKPEHSFNGRRILYVKCMKKHQKYCMGKVIGYTENNVFNKTNS